MAALRSLELAAAQASRGPLPIVSIMFSFAFHVNKKSLTSRKSPRPFPPSTSALSNAALAIASFTNVSMYFPISALASLPIRTFSSLKC